jgi:hypothetical protein
MSASNMHIRWRAVLHVGFLMGALATSVGCAASGPPEHEADVLLRLDGATYKLGQPVEATVSVTNNGDTDLLVPALDNSALKFRWGHPGAGQVLVRRPVLPAQSAGSPRVVGPGKSTSRTFLFTGLTAEPGECGLMVGLSDCRSAGAEDLPLPAYYSEPAMFTVSDELMFERDPYSGIIVRRQALALARKAGGVDETVPAGAVLVPTGETGLYLWVAWLGAGEDPLKAQAAFTVNPYSGVVKALEVGEPPAERTKE